MKTFRLIPLLPFLIVFILMVSAYAFAHFYPLTWEDLQHFHLKIKNFNLHHPIVAPFLFMSIYILYALLALPGIFILSLLAGFIFIQPFSSLYVIISATIGSTLLFLIARSAFGVIFYQQSNHFLKRLEAGFRKNAASYLLFLRLIPIFPFRAVNLAAAFFDVSLWVFVWTTFIGIIPSVFIFTEAGKNLTILLESPDPLNPIDLFNFRFIITLFCLAFLSLLPIFFNSTKTKKQLK